MLSPRLSVNIVEPYLLLSSFDDDDDDDDDDGQNHDWDVMGRYLEVTFPDEDNRRNHALSDNNVGVVPDWIGRGGGIDEGSDSSLSFGLLLMELFSDIFLPLPVEGLRGIRLSDHNLVGSATGEGPREDSEMPARKRTQQSILRFGTYEMLIERGFPSSISLVVQNLLECRGGRTGLERQSRTCTC